MNIKLHQLLASIFSFPRAWADDEKINSGDRPISLFGNIQASTTHVHPETTIRAFFFPLNINVNNSSTSTVYHVIQQRIKEALMLC